VDRERRVDRCTAAAEGDRIGFQHPAAGEPGDVCLDCRVTTGCRAQQPGHTGYRAPGQHEHDRNNRDEADSHLAVGGEAYGQVHTNCRCSDDNCATNSNPGEGPRPRRTTGTSCGPVLNRLSRQINQLGKEQA